jgi:hypothetical protein
MPAAIADLFFLEDLEEASRTGQLTESDLRSLRTVADWIKAFVTGLNNDLGRAGAGIPSCLWPWSARPFGSLLSTSPMAACHRLPNS